MGIYHQTITCSRLNHFLIVTHSILRMVQIAALETAGISGLYRMDSQSCVIGKSRIHRRLIFGDVAAGLVVGPEFDAVGAGIGSHGIDIEIGSGSHIVEALVSAPVLPAFIPALEENALKIIGLGEIYIFNGVGSCSAMARPHCPRLGAKMHPPPYPHIFLRLYP